MIALAIIIPVYLLACFAIIDALMPRKPAIILDGQCSQWRMSDDSVDFDMRQTLCARWLKSKGIDKLQYARLSTGAQSPLCGWGYAWQYQDFKPDYTIQILTPDNMRFTVKSDSVKHINMAMRAITGHKVALNWPKTLCTA